jgi:hypothetical protein
MVFGRLRRGLDRLLPSSPPSGEKEKVPMAAKTLTLIFLVSRKQRAVSSIVVFTAYCFLLTACFMALAGCVAKGPRPYDCITYYDPGQSSPEQIRVAQKYGAVPTTVGRDPKMDWLGFGRTFYLARDPTNLKKVVRIYGGMGYYPPSPYGYRSPQIDLYRWSIIRPYILPKCHHK